MAILRSLDLRGVLMTEGFISRGFKGRPRGFDRALKERIPPGQFETDEFPVLSAGPTPRMALERWDFSINGEITEDLKWTWNEFLKLPHETVTVDIHCVTKWSKLGTRWRGVALDTLFENIETAADYTMVHSYGGYTTNLPVEDLLDGRAWVAYAFEDEDLPPEHGGPARLVIPHLYFWKSAKWVRGISMLNDDEPGFWESGGYHMYGDPWLEQRYHGD